MPRGTEEVLADPKVFGELVTKVRTEALMTQVELAARSGLTRRTIGNVEHGKHLPTMDTLRRIKNVLGPLHFVKKGLGAENEGPNTLVASDDMESILSGLRTHDAQEGAIIPYGAWTITEDLTDKYLSRFETYSYRRILDEELACLTGLLDTIFKSLISKSLAIFSITCGHGWHELYLAQLLADLYGLQIHLYLLAPSTWLLKRGEQAAKYILGDRCHINIQYIAVPYLKSAQMIEKASSENKNLQRLLVILGPNQNVENDGMLFNSTLSVLGRNDLIITDSGLLVKADSDERSAMSRDPSLNSLMPNIWTRQTKDLIRYFLSNHVTNLSEIELVSEFVGPAQIKHSTATYAIERRAILYSRNGKPRTVTVLRFYRHSEVLLKSFFHNRGCVLIDLRYFGLEADPSYPACIMLLTRI